jgi:hypothetical protein
VSGKPYGHGDQPVRVGSAMNVWVEPARNLGITLHPRLAAVVDLDSGHILNFRLDDYDDYDGSADGAE